MIALWVEPSAQSPVTVTKAITFRYLAPQELSSLFEDFRLMCNEAIRIAMDEGPKNKFNLIKLAYSRLKRYGLHTHYLLSACEVAYSAYKNKKRKSVPYFSKPFLKLDNQSYRLNHLLLRIPTIPGHYIFMTLNGSDYHSSFLDDPCLRRGAVTVTDRSVSIAFSKEVERIEPCGYLGVDVNERNVTVSATNGYRHEFSELGEVVEIKQRYGEIRAKIGRLTRQDRRIAKGILSKYGKREKNRTIQRVHEITRQIVDYAKENQFGIKMEKLSGIRKKFRRGNRRGASYRGRMNSWVFGETQSQTDYKAAWLGVPAYHVNPRGTSSNCPDCGSRVAHLQDRKLYCPKCDKVWDRDDLASKNIMACAVPQARLPKGSDEKEPRTLEDAGNPSSRWEEAKPPATCEPVGEAEP